MLLLSEKSLRKIIRETVIHGKDLDCCLIESIFAEAANLGSLASRPIKQGKALIKHSDGNEDHVIVISKDGNNLNAVAAASGEAVGDGWWRLKYLHSDEPSSTPLALLGALVFHKKVLADFNVSQSAETLIKSYFEKSKDDPNLVQLEADKERIEQRRDTGSAKAHLRAGYLTPSGMESMIYKAMITGDDYVSEVSEALGIKEDKLKDQLVNQSIHGFEKAYASPERTGTEIIPADVEKKLMNALAQKDFLTAGTILYNSYVNRVSSKKTWIINWIKKKDDIVVNLVKKALEEIPETDRGLVYFDDILMKIIKKETGVPYFNVIGLAKAS